MATYFPIQLSNDEFVLSYVTEQQLNGFYPNNMLANYTTKLPQLFDLNGEWEVGLSEIQYPISWFNVSKHEAKMFMKLDEQKIMADISPPEGLYDTADTQSNK